MDKSTLNKLGLCDIEIEIYLHLTSNGVQTVKQISDKTGINRTTAYRYLESLHKKGLVEWIVDARGNKIQATRPENLDLLLHYKKTTMNELENNLPEIIANLKLSKPVQKFATQVRYYEGQKGVEQMVWNTLHAESTMRSYAPFSRREFIDSDFEDEFEKKWAQKGIKDKVITNGNHLQYIKGKLVEEYREALDVRVIPETKFYITNDIAIYNDTVAIMSLEKDNLVGVEIENKEMAKTQKSIFDIIWETAKPLELK